jgi:hypothetical protein
MPGNESNWAVANVHEDGPDGPALRGPAHPRIPWEACHPVWQTGQIPLTAGAGTLLQSNLYGPEVGYWWDLRSVKFWGFTAGTVNAYLNLINGEVVGTATTPGEFTWSANNMMAPQDTLVFNATGITGVVNMTMRAIEIATAWVPEYLM